MSEGLPPSAEQELSPEQEKAREIMRGLTHAMADRAPESGMMRQSFWRGQRGAKIVFLGLGDTTSLKVHGSGATGETSEYTFGTVASPGDLVQEELTVQHPTNQNVAVGNIDHVDLAFLEYVSAEFYDGPSEVPYRIE